MGLAPHLKPLIWWHQDGKAMGDRAAVPKMRGREGNKRDKPLKKGKLSI